MCSSASQVAEMVKCEPRLPVPLLRARLANCVRALLHLLRALPPHGARDMGSLHSTLHALVARCLPPRNISGAQLSAYNCLAFALPSGRPGTM